MSRPRSKAPHPLVTLIGFIMIGYCLGWVLDGVGHVIDACEQLIWGPR